MQKAIKNINIHQFSDEFDRQYDFLYETEDTPVGIEELAVAYETFQSEQRAFVGEFVRFRGDCISSDREAASFMLALAKMEGEI